MANTELKAAVIRNTQTPSYCVLLSIGMCLLAKSICATLGGMEMARETEMA